jgi:formyltetrahydrofolate deformylase
VSSPADFVLTLSCADQVGIVHAVARFLAEHDANILDSQQYGDKGTGRFFMRVHLEDVSGGGSLEQLRTAFAPVGEEATA